MKFTAAQADSTKPMIKLLANLLNRILGRQPVITNFVVTKTPPTIHPGEHFVYRVSFTASGNGTWQLWGTSIVNSKVLLNRGVVRGTDNLNLITPGGASDVNGLYIVAIDKKGRTHTVYPQ